MKLGYVNTRTNHHHILRDLTEAEMATHRSFLSPLIEARNRLRLFRFLDRNYLEWREFLDTLLDVKYREKNDTKDELDRLLLNYLTTVYTIQEHFEKSFVRRFRNQPEKKKKHSEFLKKLAAANWEFGFILDYRHFVQHQDLAVGHYNRTPSQTSVSISVTVNAEMLLKESRGGDWKMSKLTADRGDIDLVHAIRAGHIAIGKSYGVFVANTFFPDLKEADKFYMPLTAEAKTVDPDGTMVFFTKDVRTPLPDGGYSFEISYLAPPNDIFKELGLIVKR